MISPVAVFLSVHALAGHFVLFFFFMIVVSLRLYQNRLYVKKKLPRHNRAYEPSTSIFIPVKGIPQNFEKNLDSFFKTNFLKKSRMFFILESKEDPAYNFLTERIETLKHSPETQKKANQISVIVAGLSQGCSQKNHNLIKAIEASGRKDDVYVFLDADIHISKEWLLDLISPLSDPANTVSTGFRWLHLRYKTFGERVHSFMNSYIWALINFIPFQGVWGGSMAIHRSDFEELGVEEYWKKTVVDDMTLNRIIRKHKLKSILVPYCVSETDDVIAPLSDAVSWFKRQVQYVKYYLPDLFFWGGVVQLITVFNILCLPLAIVLNVIYKEGYTYFFLFNSIYFNLMTMIWCTLKKKPSADKHSRKVWFFLSPVYFVIMTWAGVLAAKSRIIKWSGVNYFMSRKGYVEKIKR